MASKAIHIEPVCDLTADSFIAAFRRFVARRDRVSDIYSDNGTNFVKANKMLQELSNHEEEEFNTKVNFELTKNDICIY